MAISILLKSGDDLMILLFYVSNTLNFSVIISFSQGLILLVSYITHLHSLVVRLQIFK